MSTIALSSPSLLALVEPAHGGEVLQLVDLRTGESLLGMPPFASAAPAAGALDETAWTRSYRGGWQLAAPNAGNPSLGQPFHGAASVEPWRVLAVDERSVDLEWTGDGLAARRTLRIDADGIEAETAWRPLAEPVPVVAVEHFTVGLPVLDPECVLELPGGRVDGWRLAAAGASFEVVTELDAGRADVVNRRSGTGVVLEWDVAAMPYLWLWREARASGGLWRRRGEILGLEPASVPSDAGLQAAVDQGHARRPTADDPFRHQLRVTVLPRTS